MFSLIYDSEVTLLFTKGEFVNVHGVHGNTFGAYQCLNLRDC